MKEKLTIWLDDNFILLSCTLLLICVAYAGISLRGESADGYVVLFYNMNGFPWRNYINNRELGYFTQYYAYGLDLLIKWGFEFSTIYKLFNFALVLNPFLIFLLTFSIIPKSERKSVIPFIILNYVVAILPTSSFAMSLVPEAIGLAWLSLLMWIFPPSSLGTFLSRGSFGFLFTFLFCLGYESIFAFALVFFVLFVLQIKMKLLQLPWARAYHIFTLCLILAMGFYRKSHFLHFGVAGYSWHSIISMDVWQLLLIFESLCFLGIMGAGDLLRLRQKNRTESWFNAKILSLFAVVGMGTVLLICRKSLIYEGFALRVTAPFVSLMIAGIFAIYQYRSNYLHDEKFRGFVVLNLLFFCFLDIKTTADWIKDRDLRKREVMAFSSGCVLSDSRWTIPFESILFQQTFHPKFVLTQPSSPTEWREYPKDINPCEFYPNHLGIEVPGALLTNWVRNFSFSDMKVGGL